MWNCCDSNKKSKCDLLNEWLTETRIETTIQFKPYVWSSNKNINKNLTGLQWQGKAAAKSFFIDCTHGPVWAESSVWIAFVRIQWWRRVFRLRMHCKRINLEGKATKRTVTTRSTRCKARQWSQWSGERMSRPAHTCLLYGSISILK